MVDCYSYTCSVSLVLLGFVSLVLSSASNGDINVYGTGHEPMEYDISRDVYTHKYRDGDKVTFFCTTAVQGALLAWTYYDQKGVPLKTQKFEWAAPEYEIKNMTQELNKRKLVCRDKSNALKRIILLKYIAPTTSTILATTPVTPTTPVKTQMAPTQQQRADGKEEENNNPSWIIIAVSVAVVLTISFCITIIYAMKSRDRRNSRRKASGNGQINVYENTRPEPQLPGTTRQSQTAEELYDVADSGYQLDSNVFYSTIPEIYANEDALRHHLKYNC